MSTGVASACPTCGAPLRFGGASSLVAVCAYCKSAVARRGVALESLGRVPDLVATDTRLSLGLRRKMGTHGYTVLGHVQLARPDASGTPTGTWDEWYVALDKGGWGWLAEAQGRLFFTLPVEGAEPPVPFERLRPDARFEVPSVGRVAVDEIGAAQIVGAEGELPFTPSLGATYRFADCSTADNQFVTLDYGVEGDEGAVYAGRELAWADAGLSDLRPSPTERGEEGVALQCPSCAHSLSLKQKDTRSIVCPACGALVERTEAGAEILAHLRDRSKPAIPLGTKGPLDGEACEVLGWIRRCTQVDGETYFWEEYLLHGVSGYRWLTESNGQWHLLKPIPGGGVMRSGNEAEYGGKTFKHFQSAQARYVALAGEFYWRIEVGNTVETADFVAPPNMLSAEHDDNEVNWSAGRWISPDELGAAFKLRELPPATGVGAAQPNPHGAAARSAWATAGVALVALLVISIGLLIALPSDRVVSATVPLPKPGALQPAPPPEAEPPLDGVDGGAGAPAAINPTVWLSEPFDLPAGSQAVRITAEADVTQAWVGLDVSLIEDETGDSESVALETSYYYGSEGGESWSEGSRRASTVVGPLHKGRYVLRVEPQVQREANGWLPETASITVARGPFMLPPLVLALIALLLWPILIGIRSSSFETKRWADSDHPRSGS